MLCLIFFSENVLRYILFIVQKREKQSLARKENVRKA